MLTVLTILLSGFTILISKALGLDAVSHKRISVSFLIYAVLFASLIGSAYLKGFILWSETVLVLLTSASLLCAWFSLQIQISYSISLNMLDIFVKRGAMNLSELEKECDIPSRIRARKDLLVEAGYLKADEMLSKKFKARFIVSLVNRLRGG